MSRTTKAAADPWKAWHRRWYKRDGIERPAVERANEAARVDARECPDPQAELHEAEVMSRLDACEELRQWVEDNEIAMQEESDRLAALEALDIGLDYWIEPELQRDVYEHAMIEARTCDGHDLYIRRGAMRYMDGV